MIKVSVNGYGTIGKRVADAILLQDDMELVGVSKVHPDYTIKTLQEREIPLYVPKWSKLEGMWEKPIITGYVRDMLDISDVVVDCTPAGTGLENQSIYTNYDLKCIYQGGEQSTIAPVTFVSQVNYREAIDEIDVRIASCNTTGLARTLGKLNKSFGVRKVFVTAIRRAVDPHESHKGLMDAIAPSTKIPSHHGPDVMEVLPMIDVISVAVKVPTKIMHLHVLEVELNTIYDPDDIKYELNRAQRTIMVNCEDEVDSTAEVMEMARDMGRPRNDLWETVIWEDSITSYGKYIYLIQGVHQEAIVIPENIDAIRAISGVNNPAESMRKTDVSLGII